MENENKLKVLLVRPNKKAKMVEINDDLASMQELVGGPIQEYMPFEDDVAIICNEEGKLRGGQLNRAIFNEEGTLMDIIVGDFFVCAAPLESDSFKSLEGDLKRKYESKFKNPEEFLLNPNGKICINKITNNRSNEFER